MDELDRVVAELDARRPQPIFVPLDWEKLQREGLPEVEWIDEPYLPASSRIWAAGPAESGKSIFAAWTAARLSHRGVRVAYFSQENPLAEDVRRLDRLRPDWAHLLFFHDQGLDLASPEHVEVLVELLLGCRLVIFDTLTSCWTGAESDNEAIAGLDRDVLARIVRETGCSPLILDHTGNPQAFVRRRGVHASRGASSKGQKADVVLEFTPKDGGFEITHAKNRMGGVKADPRLYRVVDADDGGLELEYHERPLAAEAAEVAERMVEAIEAAGQLSTRALRNAVGGSKDRASEAIRLLKAEDPPRVRAAWEMVETDRGKQRAKVWRPAGGGLLDD